MFDGTETQTRGPAALVREFLALTQARKLAAAQALLAPGFVMRFPGGAAMHRLEELVQWASVRYRSVAKDFERMDVCTSGERVTVVCSGTLHGVWLDGSTFAGIRFIDRFDIREGLIQQQDVWNDLAEARSQPPAPA